MILVWKGNKGGRAEFSLVIHAEIPMAVIWFWDKILVLKRNVGGHTKFFLIIYAGIHIVVFWFGDMILVWH